MTYASMAVAASGLFFVGIAMNTALLAYAGVAGTGVATFAAAFAPRR